MRDTDAVQAQDRLLAAIESEKEVWAEVAVELPFPVDAMVNAAQALQLLREVEFYIVERVAEFESAAIKDVLNFEEAMSEDPQARILELESNQSILKKKSIQYRQLQAEEEMYEHGIPHLHATVFAFDLASL